MSSDRSYDRYIANHVLRGLVRPQRRYECSINAVAGTINALFETSLNRDDVLELADWDVDDVTAGNMGNDDVFNAINLICKKKRLSVETDVFFRSIFSDHLWPEFKRQCLDDRTVLIYHAENHYTLVAGFFEDSKARYIVLAEHSSDWDPVRVVKWGSLRRQLERYRGYAILRVRRTYLSERTK